VTSRAILLPLPETLAAMLLAAGCGGGGASGAPVATTEVSMAKSYRFEPRTIAVDAGATVTWTNDDNFTHTVQVDGQDDHEVERGERVSISFARAGTYHYVCTLHRRDMDGEVIVR
jgi:plastocyanin